MLNKHHFPEEETGVLYSARWELGSGERLELPSGFYLIKWKLRASPSVPTPESHSEGSAPAVGVTFHFYFAPAHP